MKKRLMIQKRIPKYFHSDGNGIHLKKNIKYLLEKDGRNFSIEVLKEFRNFYLVSVNGRYKTTINKFQNDFSINEKTSSI